MLGVRFALSYLGARLATHICVDSDEQLSKRPIVLLGVEPLANFLRNSEYGSILLLPNVFYIEYSSSAIEQFLKNYTPKARSRKEDLKKLAIQSPSNYSSHHSIDNEYALLRWSEYIGCTLPGEIKPRLETGLYFKWLAKLKHIPKSASGSNFSPKGKGKVLLIDDEAKGKWDVFYKAFFESNQDIKFNSLIIEKGSDILKLATEKIKDFDPDVVLLDLRLQDSDFEENRKPEDYTGYEILDEIKKTNKGIQVIITTASNKVWNYQALNEIGANGYVIKSRYTDVAGDIFNLKKLIDDSLQKVLFLKKWFNKLLEIKQHLEERTDFCKNTNRNLDVAYKLLEESFVGQTVEIKENNKKYKKYAYLQLYIIIEEFLNEKWVSYESSGKWIVVNRAEGEKKVVEGISREATSVRSRIKFDKKRKEFILGDDKKMSWQTIRQTNFKMSAVLFFRYNGEMLHSWKDINNIRNNKAAHSENKQSGKRKNLVIDTDITDILNFIEFILKPPELSNAEMTSFFEKLDFHR